MTMSDTHCDKTLCLSDLTWCCCLLLRLQGSDMGGGLEVDFGASGSSLEALGKAHSGEGPGQQFPWTTDEL